MALETQLSIMHGIAQERAFQDEKYGKDGHSVGGWIMLLRAELREAEHSLIKGGAGRDHVLAEIMQVAAVAVACLEQHGMDFLTPKRDV